MERFAEQTQPHQRIFIWFFEESMTKRIKNLDGASDDLKNFFFGQ